MEILYLATVKVPSKRLDYVAPEGSASPSQGVTYLLCLHTPALALLLLALSRPAQAGLATKPDCAAGFKAVSDCGDEMGTLASIRVVNKKSDPGIRENVGSNASSANDLSVQFWTNHFPLQCRVEENKNFNQYNFSYSTVST